VKDIHNYPLYSIGVVSELLDIHPETIRTWEKSGVVQPPQRRSGKRFYSERDFKRLGFIHDLVKEGLTLRAVLYYLRLYSCWKTTGCDSCKYAFDQASGAKPCWQKTGTYCQVVDHNPCQNCEFNTIPGKPQIVADLAPYTLPTPQGYLQSQRSGKLEVK